MDPLSAIGAATSIITLAQTALALSTTIYSLCGAIASASEDLKELAYDLGVFSQSLTLLSKLLDDNRAWYTDEIYVLAAKIINDCVSLYKKIDAILMKLGGGGNTRWAKKVMFVVKGPQIRKLLERLRRLKGTLATVLMSLQVDLQLSLLHISSPSKIQRRAAEPLAPETIQVLEGADTAVQNSQLLSVEEIHTKENALAQDRSIESVQMVGSQDNVQTQNESKCPRQISTRASSFISAVNCLGSSSLRSASSFESFKSAMSNPESNIELVAEVRDVMHAFRSALEILRNIIRKRIRDDKDKLRLPAQDLETSLAQGEIVIDQVHGSNYKTHGEHYVRKLKDSAALEELHAVTSKLLEEVVTVLLMYNVDHAVLTLESFENPRIWSRKCRIKTIFELDAATVRLLPRTPNLALSTSYWSLINGSGQMNTSSAKSQPAPLQNAGPWIYVTEEEVEERLLTNESWLSGLMSEEGHYSTTAADDEPATPAPATPITPMHPQSFSKNGQDDGGENATNGQAALADAPPAAPMQQQKSGNTGMVNVENLIGLQQQQQQQRQRQRQRHQKQQQMQRDRSDLDGSRRPQSPGSAENAPSPSKRPRLEGAPFNGQQGMMPNGRGQPQGIPGQQVGPANSAMHTTQMLLQSGINPQTSSPLNNFGLYHQAYSTPAKGVSLKDLMVRDPSFSAPNSTAFTNLTSPSMYNESPEYDPYETSPMFHDDDLDPAISDPWFPLFPDGNAIEPSSVDESPLQPSEELEVFEHLRNNQHRRLTPQQFQQFQGQNQAGQTKALQNYTTGLAQHQQSQMPNNKGMPNPGGPQGQGSPLLTQGQDGGQIATYYNAGEMSVNGMRPGTSGQPNSGGNHSLQDYQMQLMLLEQQNKKRLMMARQEQGNTGEMPPNGPGGPGGQGPNGQPFQGASPQGGRTGTSPNLNDPMKRGTPQLNAAGIPSPLPEGQGRGSPGAMNFIPGQMNPTMTPHFYKMNQQQQLAGGLANGPVMTQSQPAPMVPTGMVPVATMQPQMPANAVNMSGMIGPIKQEDIQKARAHHSGKWATLSDDEIRQMIMRNAFLQRQRQLQQQRQMQQQAQLQQLQQPQPAVQPLVQRTPQPQPQQAQNQGQNLKQGGRPQPGQVGAPQANPQQQPTAPESVIPNVSTGRTGKGNQGSGSNQASSTNSQALKNNLKRPSSNDIVEVPNPNIQQPPRPGPQQPVNQSKTGQPRGLPTAQQVASMPPDQRKAYQQALLRNQQNLLRGNPADMQKCTQVFQEEMPKKELPLISMTAEQRLATASKLTNAGSKFKKVRQTLLKWYAVTHDETRLRQFCQSYHKIALQFQDREMEKLKDAFSVKATDVDIACVLANNMMADVAKQYPNLSKSGAASNGGAMQPVKPPPAKDVPPAQAVPLNAANLQQQQQALNQLNQAETHNRSNSRNAPAAATTSAHPPPFLVELPTSFTQDQLRLPPNKKQKQSATSTPVIGQQTPGSITSQNIKAGPPEIKARQPPQPKEAEKVRFFCSDISCDHHFTDGFEDEAALERHTQEEHVNPTRKRNALDNFDFNHNNDEREAWIKVQRKKRLNSRSTCKRTLSESIGSDTDDEDLQHVNASQASSGERRLRRRKADGPSLIFDDAPQVILEADEPQSGDDVVRNQDAGPDDVINVRKSGLQSLPYYDVDADFTTADSKSGSDAFAAMPALTNSSRRENPGWEILSEEQLAKLWWQAYKKFCETDPNRAEYLYDVLSTELGFEKDSIKSSDTHWSSTTLQLLKSLIPAANLATEFMTGRAKQPSAITIVETVFKTLGLESAALAWSCIVCFLKKFKKSLPLEIEDLEKPEPNAAVSEKSQYIDDCAVIYTQLEGIAGITARYAVMETLYRQAPEMSLQSDYQTALIMLCCEILKWFVHAFSVSGPLTVERGLDVFGKIWATINEMDRECQKFRITVDVPGDDSQSEADIEDVSDESLES